MNYEQVLEICLEEYNQSTDALEKEKLEIIIKALNLQIPKLIKKTNDVYQPSQCPNCGSYIHHFNEFCTYCGQSITT